MKPRDGACWDPPAPQPGRPSRRAGTARWDCANAPLEGAVPLDACHRCGCTDLDCSGCIERTGVPCHWAEPDLCSACAAEIGA